MKYPRPKSHLEYPRPQGHLEYPRPQESFKTIGSFTVKWSIQDHKGHFGTLVPPALHMPTYTVRLISCPSLLQKFRDETIAKTGPILRGIKNDASKSSIMAWFNTSSNLPSSPTLYPSSSKQVEMTSTMNMVKKANVNLTPAESFILSGIKNSRSTIKSQAHVCSQMKYYSNTEKTHKLVSRNFKRNEDAI